jgi:hypothetical protein
MFHMSHHSVEMLISLIRDNEVFVSTGPTSQLDPSVQILIFIRYLAKGHDHDTVANDFGVSQGTVSKCIERVLKAFRDYFGHRPYWPDAEERRQISEKIGIPGCVGFMDGTELGLKYKPESLEDSFFNDKKFYSLSAQGIVDSEDRILSWAVGWAGAVHDSRAYHEIPIYTHPADFFQMKNS